jgi:hypothetical protein
MDLPKYLDAPRVGTVMEGSSAEVGKPLRRRGRTRECEIRKAKNEAKIERSKTMPDKDLRQWRPDVGQKRKPIPAMRTTRGLRVPRHGGWLLTADEGRRPL